MKRGSKKVPTAHYHGGPLVREPCYCADPEGPDPTVKRAKRERKPKVKVTTFAIDGRNDRLAVVFAPPED